MASGIRTYIRNKRIKIGEDAKTAFTLIGVGVLIVGTAILAYVTYPLILGGSQEQPTASQRQYTAAQNFESRGGAGNAVGNNLTTAGGNTGSSKGVSLDDLLNEQDNNTGDDSDNGCVVCSNIGGLDTIIDLNVSKSTQAGFLSKEVTSYSAQGYGGMKASLPKPSSALNYFYLILKDSKGKLVKFNPYEHSAKYTLMEMSHGDVAHFTWDNRLLPPGKYTIIIAKGPQVLFNDSNLQILEQRQFEINPYDFSANNAQNTSSDGYSMVLEGDDIVIKSPSPSTNRLIQLRVYDMEGRVLYEQVPAIFFRDYKFKKPPVDSRVEAIITYFADTPRVERHVLLAASYPAMQNPTK